MVLLVIDKYYQTIANGGHDRSTQLTISIQSNLNFPSPTVYSQFFFLEYEYKFMKQ